MNDRGVTREQAGWARACSIIAALILAFDVFNLLTQFRISSAAIAAIGAWGFASNLQFPIGRPRRMLAILAQAIGLLSKLGTLAFLTLFIAAGGKSAWQEVPLWGWLALGVLLTVGSVAMVDGIRAFRAEK